MERRISVISGIISGISGSGSLNRGDAEKRGKTEAQPNPTTVLEVEEGWFRVFRPFRASAILECTVRCNYGTIGGELPC